MKFAESHRRIFSSPVVDTVLDTSAVACGRIDVTPLNGEYILPPLRDKVEGVDYFLPKIDLRNGNLSITIRKTTERKPLVIFDCAANETPQNFIFYNSTIGRLEVILNENSSNVYADIQMQKWGVFENYFKAGNYVLTKDLARCARFKYYDLIVSH